MSAWGRMTWRWWLFTAAVVFVAVAVERLVPNGNVWVDRILLVTAAAIIIRRRRQES